MGNYFSHFKKYIYIIFLKFYDKKNHAIYDMIQFIPSNDLSYNFHFQNTGGIIVNAAKIAQLMNRVFKNQPSPTQFYQVTWDLIKSIAKPNTQK